MVFTLQLLGGGRYQAQSHVQVSTGGPFTSSGACYDTGYNRGRKASTRSRSDW